MRIFHERQSLNNVGGSVILDLLLLRQHFGLREREDLPIRCVSRHRGLDDGASSRPRDSDVIRRLIRLAFCSKSDDPTQGVVTLCEREPGTERPMAP
jgi:hypothetical protein